MAHIIEDRVLELSTSVGIGSFVTTGAAAGFRRLSAVCAISDTFPYYIEAVDASGNPTGEYEYGTATYTALNTFSRTTIYGSSNGGVATVFSAGIKNVGLAIAAPVSAQTKTDWRTAIGAAKSGANSDITSLSALASVPSIISSSLAAIQGAFKNLQASATGTSASISISADEIAVESSSNAYATLRNVSLTGSLASSGANGLDDSLTQTITVTIASPGVVTLNAHGFPANAPVVLATTGALPTGLAAATTYYVTSPTTNTFQLSATKGGSAINTSGTQSGVHTVKSVLAVSSWYSKWVIWNGTTTAALLSSSATNPALPTGYTHKARTGWVYTDSSGSKFPLSFIQYGRRVQYKVVSGSNVANLPLMATGTAGAPTVPTWVAVAWANYAPSTASKIHVFAKVNNGAAIVAPSNVYGNKDSFTNPSPLESSASTVFTTNLDLIVESSSIYWASDGSQNLLGILGWEDNL
jgi:hypothetical protein